MLNQRLKLILQILLSADSPVTSDYLAMISHVTSRTVRNDLKELRHTLSLYGCDIRATRGKGYHLHIKNEKVFREFIQEEWKNEFKIEKIPQHPEERIHYIIKVLLLEEDYVKLEDIAERLFISRSTIINDLKDVKEVLGSYGMTLEKKPNYGLKIKGTEIQFRFCISQFLLKREEKIIDLRATETPLFNIIELSSIREILLEIIRANNLYLSDIGLNNLIYHIAIACRRVQNRHYIMMAPNDIKNIIGEKEYVIAEELVKSLQEQLHITFPDIEIAYLAIHLMGTKTSDISRMSEDEAMSRIDTQIVKLSTQMIDVIDQKFHLSLSGDKELLMGLSLHLKPTINRYRYGMNFRNPMLDEIKANYPVPFEAAVLAGSVLKENLNIDINENEIGYLALHISAAIERKKIQSRIKRCIVVCASGVGSAMLLKYKLQAQLGSKIEVVATTEYYKLTEENFDDVDFIVSTVPIHERLPIPVLVVNTILGESDFRKIYEMMNENNEVEIPYLKKELVFLNEALRSREEVFQFLTNRLVELNVVDEHFLHALIDRENIAPTCFGNLVAIPHPIRPQTDSTFWSIVTLKKPIDWGGKKVQFICLLSVDRRNAGHLKKMYELLIKVIDSEKLVHSLLKCKTYDEFLKYFQAIR